MKRWVLTKALDIVGQAVESSGMSRLEKGRCRTFLGIIRTNLLAVEQPKVVRLDFQRLIFEEAGK